MNDASPSLVAQIHQSPWRVALAITGGGSEVISRLLAVPGASQTVVSALVPYSEESLAEYLGKAPRQACSVETARHMAMRAFESARNWTPPPFVLGLGLTCSLASDRPKRGDHRAHLAFQTPAATTAISLTLVKGHRSRAEEERVVADWVLAELAGQCGLRARPTVELLPEERPEGKTLAAPPSWSELVLGERKALRYPQPEDPSERRRILLPGAFNPIHEGHRRMAEVAERRLGRPVELELSLANVDKPALDYLDLQTRITGLAQGQPIWFTRAARFTEKAELFPHAVFVVGADTIRRIADPRYYQGDARQRDDAIRFLAEYGCRFLVFGRLDDGIFQTADSLPLPQTLRDLCDVVPEEEFRMDVSSTELRGECGP
jgi:hypothetical protein